MAVVFELIFERKENYSFVIFEDELAYTTDDEVLYKELYLSFEGAKTRLKSIITEMGLDIHTFRDGIRYTYF